MKRRTKQNVGAWPNMRDLTLKQITEELLRARKKHPDPGEHVHLIISYAEELMTAVFQHQPASHVFALACNVAALSIRVAEEGDVGARHYPQAGSGAQFPKFELTP